MNEVMTWPVDSALFATSVLAVGVVISTLPALFRLVWWRMSTVTAGVEEPPTVIIARVVVVAASGGPGGSGACGRGGRGDRLAYDALAVGRVASGTLTFRRGDAESSVVVSGYGRVRRR